MSTPDIDFQKLIDAERALTARITPARQPLPPNLNELHEREATFGQRLADRVAAGAGSWTFILLFLAALIAWMAWNSARGGAAIDPFPFILLNLMLSCVAALQAPVIMMSQNRAALRDRRQADLDYRVNVLAEREIAQLEVEIDELRREQFVTLFSLQQEQLALLRHIAASRPPATPEANL